MPDVCLFFVLLFTIFIIVVTQKLLLQQSKNVTAKCTENLSPPPSILYSLCYCIVYSASGSLSVIRYITIYLSGFSQHLCLNTMILFYIRTLFNRVPVIWYIIRVKFEIVQCRFINIHRLDLEIIRCRLRIISCELRELS